MTNDRMEKIFKAITEEVISGALKAGVSKREASMCSPYIADFYLRSLFPELEKVILGLTTVVIEKTKIRRLNSFN